MRYCAKTVKTASLKYRWGEERIAQHRASLRRTEHINIKDYGNTERINKLYPSKLDGSRGHTQPRSTHIMYTTQAHGTPRQRGSLLRQMHYPSPFKASCEEYRFLGDYGYYRHDDRKSAHRQLHGCGVQKQKTFLIHKISED